MYFNAPKNFKAGRLIANRYRLIDVIIAVVCGLVSVLLILTYVTTAYNGLNVLVIFAMLLPACAGALLLIPTGVHHNVITLLELWILNKSRTRTFVWSGRKRYVDDK